MVKSQTVIDYLQLANTETCDKDKWRHFRKAAFSFSRWIGYSKIERVKTMGSRGKINPIWWNVKINLQTLVNICGYELPTNLHNFTLKDLTEVKIFQNGFVWLLYWNFLYIGMLSYGWKWKWTRSSAVAERPRNAPCRWKFLLSHCRLFEITPITMGASSY